MKKTAVIFDMDGLMFDTQCIYNKSYDEIAMSLYGFKVPPDMYLALMGSSGEDIVRAAARFMPEGVDARKFIRQSFDRVAELVKTKLPARPGLDVILPYLSCPISVKRDIASGSPAAQSAESSTTTCRAPDWGTILPPPCAETRSSTVSPIRRAICGSRK